MTLSAPTRLNPLRGFRPANFHRKAATTVIPFPSTRATHGQHVLMVEFTSPDGRRWQAVGGGDTLADAVAFARDSCPTDTSWQPVDWNDLYGD